MFDDLLGANRRYRDVHHETGLEGRAARGLAVVTCMDSRLDPRAVLGLEAGDAKIIRNAGARVTDDVLRSLVLATSLLDVVRVAVVIHTECAMAGTTDAELAERIRDAGGADVSGMELLSARDQLAALRADLEVIRTSPLLPDGLAVAGFVFDVHTGELTPADA